MVSAYRGVLDPNSARFPSGDLFRSTTDDIDPSSAAVLHSNHVAGPRRRGCARRSFEPLYRASLPLFRPRADTCFCHRHEPAVRLQKTRVLRLLRMPLLF